MFKFKHRDKEDYTLTDEDQKAYEAACKASYKEHKRLTKFEVAVKLKLRNK